MFENELLLIVLGWDFSSCLRVFGALFPLISLGFGYLAAF